MAAARGETLRGRAVGRFALSIAAAGEGDAGRAGGRFALTIAAPAGGDARQKYAAAADGRNLEGETIRLGVSLLDAAVVANLIGRRHCCYCCCYCMRLKESRRQQRWIQYDTHGVDNLEFSEAKIVAAFDCCWRRAI